MANLDLTLATEANSAGEARAALEQFRDAIGPVAFTDLRLLVSELVTDAVIAESDEPVAELELRAKLSSECVRVELEQGAVAYKLAARRAEPGEPGWGVQLAQQLSDRWGVRRGGRSSGVWIEIYLPPRESSSGAEESRGL
jgi:hypothetical protein